MARSHWLRVRGTRLVRPVQARFRSGSGTPIPLPRRATRLAGLFYKRHAAQAVTCAASCRSGVSGSLSLPLPGFFSPFPHGTSALSVAVLYSALDRGRPGFTRGSSCPALLRYRDTEALRFRLRGYHPLWPGFPAGSPAQRFVNSAGHPLAALQPRSWRFGLLPLRSPLLGESLLISLPALLRWFTSRSLAPPHYFIRARGARLAACGLPHSGTRGSMGVCPSPRLFAACRALHRTGSPGRPPRTSLSLGHIVPSRARHHMASSARLSFFYSAFPSLCLSNISSFPKDGEYRT